jgi:hypothetical protein
VAAVVIAEAHDEKSSQAVEQGLGDSCSPAALTWVAHEWIKRVREQETAEVFGTRAGMEIAVATGP